MVGRAGSLVPGRLEVTLVQREYEDGLCRARELSWICVQVLIWQVGRWAQEGQDREAS